MQATLHEDGGLGPFGKRKTSGQGQGPGLISQQPKAGFSVGAASFAAVGDYVAPDPFQGKVANVRVKATAVGEAKGQEAVSYRESSPTTRCGEGRRENQGEVSPLYRDSVFG